MTTTDELIWRADEWIAGYWNADHLRRTVHWLRVLDPGVSDALVLAALTHDMERAFPGPDMPVQDARRGPDPEYNRRHQERSARIVGEWLRQQGAGESLVAEVEQLIAVHEEGGWPEADLLQAADSLSFLEVNVDLFIAYAATGKHNYGPAEARSRVRHMYDRIRLASARRLAGPLLDAAMARFDEFEERHTRATEGRA